MADLTRREWLVRAGGVALSAALAAGPSRPARAAGVSEAPRPNMIFILADDLGYGDLGCYGQQRIRTPRLDAMAGEGIRFTQCYAGSTVCAPSRCALMTGLHTGHARIRGNSLVPLEPEDTTVAKVLHEAGYATALVGKWGLGEPGTPGVPTRQGFDYFFGYLNQQHAHNYYPEYLWRNEEQVRIEGNVEDPARRGVAKERAHYSADLFVEEALRFIEKAPQPFFLYLALTIPHANNEAGAQGMEVPSLEPYEAEAWPAPEKGRAAMITRMDRDIGALFDRLKQLGLDDSTAVFFASDNGPHKEGGSDPKFFQSSGPLRGIKRDLYEGGIRVPMVARWPGHIPAGAVSEAVWSFWDFLPTAAELAGARAPEGIDGISVVGALTGGAFRPHEHLYWEFHEGLASKQAVRLGEWKGVRLDPKGAIELYDLSEDAGETRDVAKEHRDIVRRIERCMKSARSPSAEWPLRSAGEMKKRKAPGQRATRARR